MSLKCIVGFHSWDGCKCKKCGKIRDKEHEVTADCGICSKCGQTFSDNEHDWSKDCDKCAICGKKRENQHLWLKNCEKCSLCGKVRSDKHLIVDGACQICGHGTFHDERDGSMYKIIKIGEQIIMAENFSKKPDKGNYWAYDDHKDNIIKYGCLYDWEAAKSVAPNGWHLPSKAEWESLHVYLGGDDKKAYEHLKTGGSSDFNNIFGGERYARGTFGSLGASANYWSDTAEDVKQVWQFKLGAYTESAGLEKIDPSFGLSVRLFKDKN